jgi:hypothetical protein
MAKEKFKFTLKHLREKGFVEVSENVFAPGVKGVNKVKPLTKSKRPKLPKIDLFIVLVKKELNIDLVTEYQFHPERKWRFDYAILEHKIAIEQEGGIWMKGKGAHSRPTGILRDMQKYTQANIFGWIIIRRTPDQLITNETLNLLTCSITSRLKSH